MKHSSSGCKKAYESIEYVGDQEVATATSGTIGLCSGDQWTSCSLDFPESIKERIAFAVSATAPLPTASMLCAPLRLNRAIIISQKGNKFLKKIQEIEMLFSFIYQHFLRCSAQWDIW